MAQVTVQQAVFASSPNSRVRGYQLVARSPRIDDNTAHILSQWSPSHDGLAGNQTEQGSLNYFPIGQELVAIGRTMLGLPEYSGRGGMQTVTIYLVTTRSHLARFDGDPWSLALVARSMGHMRYQIPMTVELPEFSIPECSAIGSCPVSQVETNFAQRAVTLLDESRKIAILGLENPYPTLREIIARQSLERRINTSFMTGLHYSAQRPFQLQFFESDNINLRSQLSTNQIAIVRKETGAILI